MKVIIKLSDAEYDMLKAYAAVRRKHEVGKGYRVDDAIAQLSLSVSMRFLKRQSWTVKEILLTGKRDTKRKIIAVQNVQFIVNTSLFN